MYKSMFSIKNAINRINMFYTGLHKIIPIYNAQWGEKFLMCILMCLYWTEYNEVNMRFQIRKNILALKMILTVLTFYIEDLTKDCGYIMFYVFKWLEEYFWLNYDGLILLKLFNSVYAFGLFVCLSVRLCSHCLILFMCLEVYICFSYLNRIENGMERYVRLQRRTKVFRYITGYGGKFVKHILMKAFLMHLI